MIFHIAAIVMIGMVFPAAAPEAPADGEGLKPVYFHFEAEADTVHSMAVRVDASTEGRKAYDRAMADMDGDGKFEKSITAESAREPAEGRLSMTLDFELGGKKWKVDLSGSATDPISGPVYVNWTASGKDVYAWFINAQAKPHATAEVALAAPAFRLGAPFHYEVRSSTRGPDALVSVGLKDDNGGTMRLAGGSRSGPLAGEERNITMTLLQNGKKVSTITAEYG